MRYFRVSFLFCFFLVLPHDKVRGGGQCSLKNYRTLCVPCHAAATKRLAGERAAERAAANGGVDSTRAATRKRRGGSRGGGEGDSDDDDDNGDGGGGGGGSGLTVSKKGVLPCAAGESEGRHRGAHGLQRQQQPAAEASKPEESDDEEEEEEEGLEEHLSWTAAERKEKAVVTTAGRAGDDGGSKITGRASMLAVEPPLPLSTAMTAIWKRDPQLPATSPRGSTWP